MTGTPDESSVADSPAAEGRGDALVSLRGIVKRFPGVVANDDISLSFHPGEIHVLLGENGAGKSTLIGILAGMQQPDAGLPRLFESTVHSGVLVAVIAVLLVHVMMTRTAFGLKLQVVGANPRAAVHAGLDVGKLTYATFAISAGLAGLAGSVEILGVWGTVRADWNPAYGLLVIPLVFLARFHGVATIGFVVFFAVLMIGGESASRRLGVPQFYVLVLVSLLLIFLALVEYLDGRWRKKTMA